MLERRRLLERLCASSPADGGPLSQPWGVAARLHGASRVELLSRKRFATKEQARRQVAGFIDTYNHQRRNSSASMLPPVAYEAVLAQRTAVSNERDEAA